MSNYTEISIGAGLISQSENWNSSALDRAVEMILKTSGAVARSNEAVVSTGKMQQQIYRSIRELRVINEDILRVIDKTHALLCAPHNAESWAEAFARVENLMSAPSSDEQRSSNIAAIQSDQPWRRARSRA